MEKRAAPSVPPCFSLLSQKNRPHGRYALSLFQGVILLQITLLIFLQKQSAFRAQHCFCVVVIIEMVRPFVLGVTIWAGFRKVCPGFITSLICGHPHLHSPSLNLKRENPLCNQRVYNSATHGDYVLFLKKTSFQKNKRML
jgi:hypothetical protein